MRRRLTLACEARLTMSLLASFAVWEKEVAPDLGDKIGLNPNCTDLKGLVTVPAWLTYVNHRYNPR